MNYGNYFSQIMMFSLQKVDDLTAREQEQEEKGTSNSMPIIVLTQANSNSSKPLLIARHLSFIQLIDLTAGVRQDLG